LDSLDSRTAEVLFVDNLWGGKIPGFSYKILGKTRDFPPHKLSTNSTSEVMGVYHTKYQQLYYAVPPPYMRYGYKIQLTDIFEFLHIFIYGFMDNIIPWRGIGILSLIMSLLNGWNKQLYEEIFAKSL
jgi:hypothetical protein